jgi:hypothetical protein
MSLSTRNTESTLSSSKNFPGLPVFLSRTLHRHTSFQAHKLVGVRSVLPRKSQDFSGVYQKKENGERDFSRGDLPTPLCKKKRRYLLTSRVVVKEYCIKNSFHAGSVNKNTHGSGSSLYLPKRPFYQIGGPDLAPQAHLGSLEILGPQSLSLLCSDMTLGTLILTVHYLFFD